MGAPSSRTHQVQSIRQIQTRRTTIETESDEGLASIRFSFGRCSLSQCRTFQLCSGSTSFAKLFSGDLDVAHQRRHEQHRATRLFCGWSSQAAMFMAMFFLWAMRDAQVRLR